jgi:predicted RNase H-like HicB family nuclease
MKYVIVIEKAGSNHSAYAPDLPGCVATGKTIAIVRREMRAAIRMHLEGMLEDGLKPPPARTVVEVLQVA